MHVCIGVYACVHATQRHAIATEHCKPNPRVFEVDYGAVVAEEVHLFDPRNVVHPQSLQRALSGRARGRGQAARAQGRAARGRDQTPRRRTCRRLSSVEAVLWTAFFFRRTDPFPPVRTCPRAPAASAHRRAPRRRRPPRRGACRATRRRGARVRAWGHARGAARGPGPACSPAALTEACSLASLSWSTGMLAPPRNPARQPRTHAQQHPVTPGRRPACLPPGAVPRGPHAWPPRTYTRTHRGACYRGQALLCPLALAGLIVSCGSLGLDGLRSCLSGRGCRRKVGA